MIQYVNCKALLRNYLDSKELWNLDLSSSVYNERLPDFLKPHYKKLIEVTYEIYLLKMMKAKHEVCKEMNSPEGKEMIWHLGGIRKVKEGWMLSIFTGGDDNI